MAKLYPFNWNSILRGSLRVGALGLVLGGCNAYDATLLNSITSQVDSGGTVACTAGSVGCIPSKPAASTSAAGDSMDVTFALRDVLLTQSNPALPANAQPWKSIGFDLDGIDTATNTSPNGCSVPPNPDDGGIGEGFPIDGMAGIDNQFGAQLAGVLLPLVAPQLQNDLCCMQNRGRGTLLLRIRKWNGQADDASVTLSLTTANDGTASLSNTVMWDSTTERGLVNVAGGAAAAPPSWSADSDSWYTNAGDVSGGDVNSPRHFDIDGYVSSGYLVMHLDARQPIKLYLGHDNGIAIGLLNGTLIGHISANGHLIDEGWIGGRMGSAELLDASYRLQATSLYSEGALGTSSDFTTNAQSCMNTRDIINPLLDAFGDVLANGTNNTAVPCDALSAGVAFHGVRAREVLVAPQSLSIPLPDCDGQTAVFGTVTASDELVCPFGGTQPAVTPCAIPAWSSGG